MWHPYGLSVWVSSQQLPNQQLEGVMASGSLEVGFGFSRILLS